MKQIFEKGDRVKLVGGEYSGNFIGTSGTVSYVVPVPHDDGSFTVTYVLDSESQIRMNRVPGFGVQCNSKNLKYLKPKDKNKEAKIDVKFAKKVDKLVDKLVKLAMKANMTKREQELVSALDRTLEALDVLAYIESTEPDVNIAKLKKSMLVELR
jgi:hypothetical protein